MQTRYNLAKYLKKKTTTNTDKTRQGLEQAGVSSKDMQTDYEKTQNKTAPAATPAKTKDPIVPVEQIGDIAKSLTDADKERKRRLAMAAMSRAK